MSRKVLVKKVLLGNGNIMLYRRTYVFFFIPAWRPWKLMNNDERSQEGKISAAVDKLKKEIEKLMETKSWLKAEVKEFNGRYESEPFYMPVKGKDYFYKRVPDLPPVDGSWRAFINPKALGDKPQGIRGKMGLEERKTSKAAYLPSELSQFKINVEMDKEIEVDSAYVFREPSNNQGKKSPRKKRDGETDAEHKARLKRMDSGDYSVD